MTKLELVKHELDKNDVFNGKLNNTALDMVKMLGDDIPFSMALGIANYVMASFVGHFHYKILMNEGNLVPPNIIVFILAKSGAKKTSSVLKLEGALSKGIDKINEYRMRIAKERADEEGLKPKKLNPLDNALATEAGMIKRLNDFKNEGIGLPTMFVDEISTELATNPDIVPNIKLVSQLFDIGEMKSKPLKDSENQSDPVSGMGMCAMFIGSEHGILEDQSVLTKFETEFISKLSRRVCFEYPDFSKNNTEISEDKTHEELIEELLKELEIQSQESYDIKEKINRLSYEIAVDAMEQDIRIIGLEEDARRLYLMYKLYCEELSESIDEEALNLEQQHRHWKAFKLAGTYAVFNKRTSIHKEDLIEAINYVELIAGDLAKFIYKAKREVYEILLDHYIEGGRELNIHDMIKKGWIKKQSDLKNLIINANSKLGKQGVLSEEEDKVIYSPYTERDGIGASFMLVSGTKEERAKKCADGFIYKITTFEKLANLLSNDTAYSPFEFQGGKRGRDNVLGGADFIVLDIDDSDITWEECHNLLMDYKHLIAKTSDDTNPYKFRCLITLDIQVELNSTKWKLFMQKVSDHLGIKIDNLPQSQIYFGYKHRTVLVNEEGMDLEASTLIKDLGEPTKVVKPQKKAIRDKIWLNRKKEFEYAYKGRASGFGLHNGLFRAMRHAYDLGFSYYENKDLLDDIIDSLEEKPRDNFLPSLESQRKMVYGML